MEIFAPFFLVHLKLFQLSNLPLAKDKSLQGLISSIVIYFHFKLANGDCITQMCSDFYLKKGLAASFECTQWQCILVQPNQPSQNEDLLIRRNFS